MKKKIKVFAKIVFFLVTVFFLLFPLTEMFRVKNTKQMASYYYHFPDDSFDVVFLGTSITYSGFYPMQLWHDYGITSFNLGSANQTIPMSYYLIEEAIEKHSPKLIVLDCSMILEQKEVYATPYLHFVTDNMPYFSPYRFKMFMNLAKHQYQEFLIPFVAYHDQFENLKKDKRLMLLSKYPLGARVRNSVYEEEFFEKHEIDRNVKLGQPALEYLLKIKKLCDDKHVSLCLTQLPFISPGKSVSQEYYDERRSAAYMVGEFAEQNDMVFYNFVDDIDKIGIVKGDTTDGEHLNVRGGTKMTRYFAENVLVNYQLPDHRDDSRYDFMDKAYEEYLKFLQSENTELPDLDA